MTPPTGAEATRQRVFEATVACVERTGLIKTSLEDVASEASISRATVYRHFPGGRDEVISETVAWEVGNFLLRLREAVVAADGLEAQLVLSLVIGHRAIHEHKLLQRILCTEPEALMAELAETSPMMLTVLSEYLAEQLANEQLQPGVDIDEAADYLARMYLSYLGSSGRADLHDPQAVGHLVRTRFIAGILAPAATSAS